MFLPHSTELIQIEILTYINSVSEILKPDHEVTSGVVVDHNPLRYAGKQPRARGACHQFRLPLT
jgi:hypothetical protein